MSRFIVNLITESEDVIGLGSVATFSKALQVAYKTVTGHQHAECTVRADGRLWAVVSTDWRGDVEDVEIEGPTHTANVFRYRVQGHGHGLPEKTTFPTGYYGRWSQSTAMNLGWIGWHAPKINGIVANPINREVISGHYADVMATEYPDEKHKTLPAYRALPIR